MCINFRSLQCTGELVNITICLYFQTGLCCSGARELHSSSYQFIRTKKGCLKKKIAQTTH